METSQDYFRQRIDSLKDFNEAFEIVKSAVSSHFKMQRAGLSLLLQVMPSNLGAYHILGSNVIVINSHVLEFVKKASKAVSVYNAYLFMVLLHEYLHSFGIIDENRVRNMTYELCKTLLGDDHKATIMAKLDPSNVIPEMRYLQNPRFGTQFEIVKNFDKSNQTYIH